MLKFMKYTFEVAGVPDDGFTSAEILAGDEMVARVYELESGWHIETRDLERLRDARVVDAMIAARNELLHYVNRKGTNRPEGLTVAGASLWLMQRDDGKGFTI